MSQETETPCHGRIFVCGGSYAIFDKDSVRFGFLSEFVHMEPKRDEPKFCPGESISREGEAVTVLDRNGGLAIEIDTELVAYKFLLERRNALFLAQAILGYFKPFQSSGSEGTPMADGENPQASS